MRLDLGGKGVSTDTDPGDELFAETMPVHLGIGNQMGVVIADCAIHFAQILYLFKLALLTRHAIGDICYRFATR